MEFRCARHTNNLKRIIDFYCKYLKLEVIGNFDEHDGYSGVFLGKKGMDWHLEFTVSDSKAEHHFDPDDILVFYPKTINEYNSIVGNISSEMLQKPINPYWRDKGLMIQDPDGYNIVICSMRSK